MRPAVHSMPVEAKAAERRRTPKRKRVNVLATTATLWSAAVLCRFLIIGLGVIR